MSAKRGIEFIDSSVSKLMNRVMGNNNEKNTRSKENKIKVGNREMSPCTDVNVIPSNKINCMNRAEGQRFTITDIPVGFKSPLWTKATNLNESSNYSKNKPRTNNIIKFPKGESRLFGDYNPESYFNSQTNNYIGGDSNPLGNWISWAQKGGPPLTPAFLVV